MQKASHSSRSWWATQRQHRPDLGALCILVKDDGPHIGQEEPYILRDQPAEHGIVEEQKVLAAPIAIDKVEDLERLRHGARSASLGIAAHHLIKHLLSHLERDGALDIGQECLSELAPSRLCPSLRGHVDVHL